MYRAVAIYCVMEGIDLCWTRAVFNLSRRMTSETKMDS